MGASSVSTIPDIVLYKDSGTPGYDIEDTSLVYTDDFNPSIKAKFSFLLGAASVEYVMPLLQDLELSSGALMGLGRVSMAIDQQSGNPRWNKIFSNAYGTMTDGTLYYPVTDIDNPDQQIVPGEVAGLQRDVSATFFNFQPYVAVKWQFLERLGLRISMGANKGTVPAGSWKLNGRTSVSDSPQSSLSGLTFRTMLYIGL